MSASNSPVDSSSSETPPEIPASFPAETTEVEDPFVAEDKVVESSEPAPLPSSLPSKSRPATVEDAQDSDNDDAQPVSIAAKTAEEIEDEISRKIAAMEGEGAQQQPPPPAAHSWQAVWSPAQNMYYFYNTETNETTWTNPLVNPHDSSDSTPAAATGGESPPWDPSATTLPGQARPSSSPYLPFNQPSSSSTAFSYGSSQPEQPVASSSSSYGGIDPGLSHLLPPSYNPLAPGGGYAAQARFNQRTGRFDADPNHTPDHLSDFNRMKRQNGAFFDQEAWEREREEEHERAMAEGGGKKRKLTKAEVARFKEKKEAKKSQRNSWLRS